MNFWTAWFQASILGGSESKFLSAGGLSLAKDLRFTALTTKAGAETALLVYSHVGAEPSSGQTRFRFMNGAPEAGVVRIEIDALGSSVPINTSDLQPQDVFDPVLVGQATVYLEGDPGDYTFTVYSAGGAQLAQSQVTQLGANSGWTIVIFDDGLTGDEPALGLPGTKVGAFTQQLYDEAKKDDWIVISMKNDWNRIFAFDQ